MLSVAATPTGLGLTASRTPAVTRFFVGNPFAIA
jgi:hypothetical protein